MAVTKVCFPLSSSFFCLCCLLWLHMKSTPGMDTLLLSHLPVGAVLRSWRTQVSEDAPAKIIPCTTSLLFLPASCLWSMGQVTLPHVPTARMFCRPVMYQFLKLFPEAITWLDKAAPLGEFSGTEGKQMRTLLPAAAQKSSQQSED